MKKLTVVMCGLAGVGLTPFAATLWAEHRYASPSAIQEQVGVSFPDHVAVVDTKAELFSLADGTNFQWLISSDSSLLPWLEATAQLEGPGTSGWTEIRCYQDVSPFQEPRFSRLTLHSVWRINRAVGKREETSYLYLASDKTTAVLATFRP